MMRMPRLQELSLATRTLLTKLTSWRTLNQRWQGSADTLALLDDIASACEPLAIPELMSFGLAENDHIRTKARSIIWRLFERIPTDALPLLDESLRRSWGHLEDWYGMKPERVETMAAGCDADRLYLALLTCHRNGYVRAEALRVLGEDRSEIVLPFILIRLVDWVRPVASAAEIQLRNRLEVAHAAAFVNCLGLIDRLATNSRYRPEYSEWIDGLLKHPNSADALQRGMNLSSAYRAVRRHCFRVAIQNPGFPTKMIVERALIDSDVIVRKWAFSAGNEGLSERERAALMRRAENDSYRPIRRIAFEAAVADPFSSLSGLKPFLLDGSAAIRRECQSVMSKRQEEGPAAFYRAEIHNPNAKMAAVAVVGLAETGERTDATLIAEMLAGHSARVRRAAVRGLRLLGVVGQEAALLRLVSSDVPSVVREAAFTLLSTRGVLAEHVWSEAERNVDRRVLLVVLKLLNRAAKWQQLRIYLHAANSTDPNLAECAVAALASWLRKYNSTFVQPSADDTSASLALIEALGSCLPERLAEELKFILQTIAK
jgi:hypothetical protein